MNELVIDRLGAQGDGVANSNEGSIFVPFTLQGETVAVSGSGKRRDLETVVSPSPSRVEPICMHFGKCGGCQLQHMEQGAYLEWKRDLVKAALQSENISIEVDPVRTFENGKRRRAVFSARQTNEGLVLGYLERGSHTMTAVQECPVLLPEIVQAIEPIKQIVSGLIPAKDISHVSVLACDNGLDISIECEKAPSDRQRQTVIRRFMETDFCRLSVNGEVVIEQKPPLLTFGKTKVTPAPGGFVQAVKLAETAMSEIVIAHLSRCKKTVDLFCGSGTFALDLAEFSSVIALESEAASIAALELAWRNSAGKLRTIKAEKRDLSRRPLTAAEMKKIDGVVFDPPRAGAEMQAKQLAKSKVKKIAAVSCSPTTLARDLRILINGGYKLLSVTPLDQFVYTPHIEVVALLER